MPALATHWLFARDALNRYTCPPALKKQLAIVSLGAQGPDPLFFHRRIPWRIRSTGPGDVRAFASSCHSGDPRNWLYPPLKLCNQLPEPEREKLAALVYGFFLHYHLDRIVHPFVFSKSGFDENGELSPPWNARHAWFETLLDFAFLEQRGVRIQAIRPWCMMSVPAIDLILLSSALARSFPDQLKESQYREACLDMQGVYRLLHDSFGWKRRLVEKTGKTDLLMAAFIAPQSLSVLERETVLGLGSTPWPDPASGKDRFESFGTLYGQALEEVDGLNAVWEALLKANDIPEALDAWIGTRNHDGLLPGTRLAHHTGLDKSPPYSPSAGTGV